MNLSNISNLGQSDCLALAIQELERRQSLTPSQPQSTKPIWEPLPGAQKQALESEADILLYGGAAGGGKTDLVLGASRLKHHRSIIFRRTYPALSAIIDRARRIYNPDGINAAKDSYNEQLHRWRFQDGSQIRFGSIQYEKDVFNWQGQAYDLHCFDELCEFTES